MLLQFQFNINTVYPERLFVCKSDDCANNQHGSCRGLIKEIVNSSTITKMCACQCHDSTYQLVRNTIVVINRDQLSNPYQFTHDGDV